MQVQLFKKVGKYTDKEGKEKQSTRFYVRCGDSLIPIAIPYFEGDDGRDYQYNGRKEVLKAFAETLPEMSVKEKPEEKGEAKSKLRPFDDDDDSDIPF